MKTDKVAVWPLNPSLYRAILPYVQISRIEHWPKNLLFLPGVVLALRFETSAWYPAGYLIHLATALLSICLVSSGNYIINEILDAPYDSFHPTKRHRPMASGIARPSRAWLAAALFYGAAFFIAWPGMNPDFVLILALFLLVGGILYNVPPFRCKEVAVLDVIIESANNPIRMLLGWHAITAAYFPVWSLLVGYWAFGAFIMAGKRLSERRHLQDADTAALYRRSFKFYSERRLRAMMILAALVCLASLGNIVFLHRIFRLWPSLPLCFIFIYWVFRLVRRNSIFPREPEKVWREPLFAAYVVVSALILFVLMIPEF